MSTPIEGPGTGITLLQYRLDKRLGRLASSNVWRATDMKLSRPVALKILSRSLPREKAKRDAYIREVKVGAAVHHPNLATIYDLAATEETLFMVMELLEGMPVSELVKSGLPGRDDFLKYTWQAVEALNALHSRGTIHGRVNGDNFIVTPEGRLRVCGLGMASFAPRRGDAVELSSNVEDISWISYLAPEQIVGKPADARADFFSLGVVLYLMSTGRLPFQAVSVTDLANQIVKSAAQTPQAVNPRADLGAITVIGKCLFKEPAMRYVSARLILDDIKKIDPRIQTLAAPPATATRAQAAASSGASTLFIAELPYHDLMRKKDASRASRLEALMQQMLGEAVYLFDGKVVDSMGPRMIATMPDATAAVAAARKGMADLVQHNSTAGVGGDVLEPRAVLHAGAVTRSESGSMGGAAADLALGVLASLEPSQLLVSESVFRGAGFPVDIAPVGSFGDVRFYQLPPEKPPVVVEPPPEVVEVEEEAPPEPPKKSPLLWIGGIAALVILLVGGFFLVHREATAPPPVAVPIPRASSTARVALQPFTLESADPQLTKSASSVQRAATEILKTAGGMIFVTAPESGARSYSAIARTGATGIELIPTLANSPLPNGASIPLSPIGPAVVQLVDRITRDAHGVVPALNTEAVEKFAAALDSSTSDSRNDRSRAIEGIRASIAADPGFLAAQRLAVDLFDKGGDRASAIAAASKVMELDPLDHTTARRLVSWYQESGSPASALDVYANILKKASGDREALAGIGAYAVSAGDDASFSRVLGKLAHESPGAATLFAPDIILATGRIDAAAQKYYDAEAADPQNAALSLRIGRVAVLRRSLPIAAIEAGKLEKLDPAYGLHLLNAYVEAETGHAAPAIAELNLAAAAPPSNADFYTASAEVYTLLNQPRKAMESLKKAVDRSEPTAAYILSNPIFRYLHTDSAWAPLSAKVGGQKSAAAARLSAMSF